MLMTDPASVRLWAWSGRPATRDCPSRLPGHVNCPSACLSRPGSSSFKRYCKSADCCRVRAQSKLNDSPADVPCLAKGLCTRQARLPLEVVRFPVDLGPWGHEDIWVDLGAVQDWTRPSVSCGRAFLCWCSCPWPPAQLISRQCVSSSCVMSVFRWGCEALCSNEVAWVPLPAPDAGPDYQTGTGPRSSPDTGRVCLAWNLISWNSNWGTAFAQQGLEWEATRYKAKQVLDTETLRRIKVGCVVPHDIRHLCTVVACAWCSTVTHPRWARFIFPSPSCFEQVPWWPFPLAWPSWGPMMSLHPALLGPCQLAQSLRRRRYECMYACMYVCMDGWMDKWMDGCMCVTYVCMYVCTYVCMYVRTYVRMYVCIHVSLYVCMYVCV